MAKKRRKRRPRRPPAKQGTAPQGQPGQSAVAVDDAQRVRSVRGRNDPGPPPAPWGSFPLSEIAVAIGIVLLFAGFFVSPPRGPVMIGTGLVLGSLAGLELSAREHLAGYRSHTLLLAGAAGMIVLAGTFALTEISPVICLAAGVAVFGLAAWRLAGAFRKRSGGSLFKVRGD